LAWPLCTYNTKIDNALENYRLKSDVITLSGITCLASLFIKAGCNYTKPFSAAVG